MYCNATREGLGHSCRQHVYKFVTIGHVVYKLLFILPNNSHKKIQTYAYTYTKHSKIPRNNINNVNNSVICMAFECVDAKYTIVS